VQDRHSLVFDGFDGLLGAVEDLAPVRARCVPPRGL